MHNIPEVQQAGSFARVRHRDANSNSGANRLGQA
jgi:hypothetical protein